MASSSSVGIPTASGGGGGTGYGGGSGRIDSLSSPPPLYMADQHSYQHHLQSTAVNRQKVITDSTDELANRFRYTNFQSSVVKMNKKYLEIDL